MLILVTLILSAVLILKSLEENVIYFKSPTEIKTLSEIEKKKSELGEWLKIAQYFLEKKELKFIVTDFKNE